jgi:hypothetical protein
MLSNPSDYWGYLSACLRRLDQWNIRGGLVGGSPYRLVLKMLLVVRELQAFLLSFRRGGLMIPPSGRYCHHEYQMCWLAVVDDRLLMTTAPHQLYPDPASWA